MKWTKATRVFPGLHQILTNTYLKAKSIILCNCSYSILQRENALNSKGLKMMLTTFNNNELSQ